MPKSDNRGCRLGLRLDLVSKLTKQSGGQKAEQADIGQYFTMGEANVNLFLLPIWIKSFQK
jgi:hypothetical protein